MKVFLLFALLVGAFAIRPIQPQFVVDPPPYPTVDLALKFIQNFFKGLNKEGDTPIHIPDPLQYVQPAHIMAFLKAIDDIRVNPQRGIMELAGAAMTLIMDLQGLIEATKDPQLIAEFQKLIAVLSNPQQLLQILPGLLFDPLFMADIKEIIAAGQAYAKDPQQLPVLGLKIGQFINLLLKHIMGIEWESLVAPVPPTVDIAIKFIQNFFKGLNKEGDTPINIPDPLQYVQPAHIIAFIDALNQVRTNPTVGIFQLVSAGMTLFLDLQGLIEASKDPQLIAQFQKLIATFKDPHKLLSILPQLLFDPLFMNDIKECIDAGRAYYTNPELLPVLGLKIGELLNCILKHIMAVEMGPTPVTPQLAMDFISNLFKGLNKEGDTPIHIPDPLKYVQPAHIMAFINALQAVRTNPAIGIFQLVAASQALLLDVQALIQASQDPQLIAEWQKLVDTFKDPQKLLAVLPQLIFDPMFMNDIKECIDAGRAFSIDTNQLPILGLKIGNLFNTILKHIMAMGAPFQPTPELCLAFIQNIFKGLQRDPSHPLIIPDPTQYIQMPHIMAFIKACQTVAQNPGMGIFMMISSSLILVGDVQNLVLACQDPELIKKFEALKKSFEDPQKAMRLFPALLLDPMFVMDIKQIVDAANVFAQDGNQFPVLGLKIGELLSTIMKHVVDDFY